MSEAIDKLKSIGAQKISEDTHIPSRHIEAIFVERFEGLSKVQFIGFISILERDYGVDLSETREHCLAHFQEQTQENEAIADDVVLGNSQKRNMTPVYIIGAIALLLIAIYYTMHTANEKMQSAIQEHNNTLKEQQKNIAIADINLSETNNSEQNSSLLTESNTSVQQVVPEPKAVKHSLEISPRMKVWLGYIDVATNKKYQKTFQGNLELDPSKEWLLYFGHGFVDVDIDGELTKFSDKDTLRLHYEDGKIEKISKREFKRLNRGNSW